MKKTSDIPEQMIPGTGQESSPLSKLSDDLYQKQFTAIFESSDDAIYGEDLDCRITSWNNGAEVIYGYTPEDIIGKNVSILVPAEAKTEDCSLFERLVKGERIKNYETLRVRKDGSSIHVSLSILPIKDGHGNVIGGVTLASDITERKIRERQLVESEIRFQAIFEQAAVGVAVVNTQTKRFLKVNKKLCDILGYTNEEFMNLSLVTITHPDDRHTTLSKMSDLIQGKIEGIGLEKRYIHKDGSIVWAQISVNPLWLKGQTDNTTTHLTIVEDITDRKKAEIELIRSEKNFRDLLSTMTDGFVAIDMKGNFLHANKAYEQLTGYTNDELSKLNFYDITPAKWYDYENKIIQNQIISLGYSEIYEKEYIRKDGTIIPIELHAYLIKNEKGEAESMWGLVRDLSKRKSMEADVRKSERKFSKIFNTSPFLLAINDIETGKFIEVNNQLLKLLGVSRDEVIGSSSLELGLFSYEGRERLIENFKQGKSITGQEINFKTKDNRIITCLFNIDLIEIEGINCVLSSGIDITERKQTEVALQKSEEKFSRVFNTVPVFLAISEIETGRYLDINEHAFTMLGFTKDEMIGRTSIEIGVIKTEERSRLLKIFQSQGRVNGIEVELFKKNGEPRICLFNIDTIEIDGVKRFVTSGTDITERKHTELELKKSEQKFSHVFNNAPILISISDIETDVFLEVNEYLLTLLGYTREELIGHSPSELDILLKWERDFIIKALQSGMPVAGSEVHFRTKSGASVTCLFNIDFIEIYGVKRLLSTGIDITDRKKIETALQESELKFRQIFTTVDSGILYLDEKGTVHEVNPSLTSIFEISKSILIGRSIQESIIEKYGVQETEEFIKAVLAILRGASVLGLQFRLGGKYLEVSTFRDINSSMITCVVTNLTAREKIEDEKIQLIQRLHDILLAIPDILVEVDIQKIYVWANESAFNFFGRDVLGKEASYYFVGEQDTYDKVEALWSAQKDLVYVESWQKRSDGQTRLLAWWCRVIKNSQGVVTGVLSSARDITFQREREEELRESHEQLKRLNLYIETIRENERSNLAREIHDELGQSLTALKIDLKNIQTEHLSNEKIHTDLHNSIKSVDTIISSVQTISSDLHPQILDDLGLTTAIEWYIRGFEERTKIQCLKNIDSVDLEKTLRIHLFRIVQESMTNIARHSKATKVKITLKKYSGRFVLTINDNGIGIPVEQQNIGHSLGMLSMKERAEIINGTFTLSSLPKKGTTIKVSVTLEAKKAK